MKDIKSKFHEKALSTAADLRALIKDYGKVPIEEVTISQVFEGMHGIPSMIGELSLLDPNEGIRFRGHSIPELQEKLPKAAGGAEPLPEGLFYLMLIGEMPTDEDVKTVSNMFAERSRVPDYVYKTIDALPVSAHPMTQYVTGIMAMQTESVFAKAYSEGLSKKDYWDSTYEDALNIIARAPYIAAYVFNRKYRNGKHFEGDKNLDWAANFAKLLGYSDSGFIEMMRLYMTIHADHEVGNVSAHAVHLVNSALADLYLSYAAGMNGLAGPLHGLANQEVIKWIFEMLDKLKTDRPTKEQIAQYAKDTLAAGKIIPGYGHGVLRITDPRFTAQMQFAKQHMPDDPIVNTVWNTYAVVPEILGALGKVKNPYPNVDAHSGALLVHYGMKEFEFYTVLFAVSRALGVLATACWSRAMGLQIERPRSITVEQIKKWLNSGAVKGTM